MSAVVAPKFTTPSPASQPPPAAAKRMTLAKVVKGKLVKPTRVLVYGIEGVGKSSFAAAAPAPIFLGAEDGTSELDVARFPEPRSWQDTIDGIAELTTTEHEFKTLVIDTLDWLEPMCWAHVCVGKKDKAGKRIETIEDFGYGKGYTAALDAWRELLKKLERLRAERGMSIVLIAHSWIKSFKNPAGEDYDRHEMKLHAKAGGLLREWCDAVLFATHEVLTYELNGRVKGISNGARVLHTERCAAWDAKNRYDLPEKLPLDWEAFADAVAAHRPADPVALKTRILELLEHVDATKRPRVEADLKNAGDDAAALARIANKLSATVTISTTATEAT
jgi:AAA domain